MKQIEEIRDSVVVGIDPGANGGIAAIFGSGVGYDYKPLKSDDGYVDVEFIINELYSFKPTHIILELVHSIHGTGAKSNFNFGRNFGMILATCRIYCDMNNAKLELVPPKDWQKSVIKSSDISYKNGKKDTKLTALNAAKRLFPDDDFIPKGKRVPHDGVVDALLIAYSKHNNLSYAYNEDKDEEKASM